MYSGGALTILSSLQVQEFLNKNITLNERDKDPILGIRNVKTTYNAFKHDVMFTFYDDLIGTEEKVWNLCYNLALKNSLHSILGFLHLWQILIIFHFHLIEMYLNGLLN